MTYQERMDLATKLVEHLKQSGTTIQHRDLLDSLHINRLENLLSVLVENYLTDDGVEYVKRRMKWI